MRSSSRNEVRGPKAHDGDRGQLLTLWLVPSVLILLAAAFRLLPHPPNFTPLGALALFAGATLPSKRWSLFAPIGAMLLSDWVLGFHPYMPVVYGCLTVNVLVGWWLGQHERAHRVAPLAGAALFAAVLFFLVTNFAVWLEVYPRNWAGLSACYTAAIPFFRYTLMGNLAFTALLFGAYQLGCHWLPAARPERPVHGSQL